MKLPFSDYVKAHHISHALLSVGALAAALVFFAAGAFIRLLVGPVSLGPLQQSLAGAIQSALPGITLQYDKAAIEWDRDVDRVELVVLGTRILDQRGKVVASAPQADIDLAATPILQGKMAVQRITLVGVSFRLIHMKDGGIRLGAEGDPVNDVYARLYDVINARGSSTSTLKSFAVRNANLMLYDEVSGLNVAAPRANLSITARGQNLLTNFSADVDVAGKTAHVAANLTLPSGNAPITGDAAISHLDLAALATDAPLFRPLHILPLSTDLSAKFSVVPGGHVSQTDFDLSAAGDIPFAALKDKALHVRQLRLTGHYDGVRNRLEFSQASLDAREALVRLKGGADIGFANGELESIAPDIQVVRAIFNMPGVLPGPVQLQSAQFRGRYHATARSFDVDKFTVTGPQLALDVKGTVQLGEPGQAPGMMLTGTLAPIPVRAALGYWPLQWAPGARGWIAENILAGNAGPLAFETHFMPGTLDQPFLPDDALKLTFPLTGVEGNYLEGLTHVTQVSGTATLTGDGFSADFTSGRIGPLALSNGHALIPTLHARGAVAEITTHVDGAMPDIMTLIDMKPLGYPSRFGLDPKQTAGTASAELDVKVPMLADLKVDDVGINVKADVQNYGITLGKLRLSNGDVEFTVDNNSLHQTGSVMLADTRIAVDWSEDFKTGDPITTRLNVKGSLTEGARAALNIGLGNIVTGPIGVSGTLLGHRGELRSADLAVDLTAANILIPIVHLSKPAAQAATGRVTVNFGPGDNISDETMRLTGANLAANGTANFDAKGGLTTLNFPSVRLGTLNDFSFVLARSAAGDNYTLRGRAMDGSLLGRGTPSSPGANASTPPPDETPSGAYHIDAKLDRVSLRDGVGINGFALDLSGVGERPAALSLAGNLVQGASRGAALSAAMVQSATGRELTINSADAGLLIRGMFAFDSLRGGKMLLSASLPGRASDTGNNNPDFTGKLTIEGFTMVNQPFLSRLFAAGSLTGVADLLGGQGITDENLEVPFSSDNDVISVKDARASGPAVGATADGYIDRPHNQVALKGTLVPAYGLNSVLSNIPLLGDILAGKKGEGIIGVTYSATGNADEPRIATNPVSVLTPGFLRRIWEGHMPTPADAPTNKAAATAAAGAPGASPAPATAPSTPTSGAQAEAQPGGAATEKPAAN